MSLYVVRKRNPYLRPGTFVESFDDGFQKCRIAQEGNRLSIRGHEGIIIPYTALAPFVSKVMKTGLDK